MPRIVLAFAAAFALASAAPALAAPCDDCPMHKDKVAAADKEKKDVPAKCACGAADPKDCKCGAKCDCPMMKKAAKKDAPKT